MKPKHLNSSSPLSGFDLSQVTFENLRVKYRTGRSVLLSGSGRDKVYGYRSGMQTNLGDIEEETWIALARDLIDRTGEQELFSWMLAWEKEHTFYCQTKKELEFEALNSHISRIFDDEAWCDFIPFNRKYRPEVLKEARMRWVKTDCCKKPGLVTQGQIDWAYQTGGTIVCPHCTVHSHFSLCTEDSSTPPPQDKKETP